MKTKQFITTLAAFTLMAALTASCGNPAGDDDDGGGDTVRQPLDPAVTARDSAAFAASLEEFALKAESGETLDIDLARYEAALLRLPPAARKLNSTLVKNVGAPGCFEYAGELNITVRIRNSGGERKTLALKRTGGGGLSYDNADLGALLYAGRGVTLEVSGPITLEGISLARNGLDNFAPVVLVEGGSFVLSGGARITNNCHAGNAPYGGGLAVAYNGSALITDNAEITGCKAANGGGGAAAYAGGQLTMEKTAKITNCSATGAGGGGLAIVKTGPVTGGNYREVMCVLKDEAKVSDCRVEGNGKGGGVSVSGATFRMYGNSEISGNEWAYKPAVTGAAAGGGGVSLSDGAIFIMEDKSAIKENRAFQQLNASEAFTNGNASGGGVYIGNHGSGAGNIFEMRGESRVSDNFCAGYLSAYGGGIYLTENYSNTVKITGKSRVERNAAFILKNTKDRTILADYEAFKYAAGSAVFVKPEEKIILDGEAAIPREEAVSAIADISPAARKAFEASGISPENFILLEKSDTTNSIALELLRNSTGGMYKGGKLEPGVDYNPASPLVIDVTADRMSYGGRYLQNRNGSTDTNYLSIFTTASGFVCYPIHSSINTDARTKDLHNKNIRFTNYTPSTATPTDLLTGSWTGNFTVVPTTGTGDPKTYTVTLSAETSPAVSWTFTVITGRETPATEDDETVVITPPDTAYRTDFLVGGNMTIPIFNIDDFASANFGGTAERTVLSGGAAMRNAPVTLGRFVSTMEQTGGTYANYILPALVSPFFPPVELSAYTINASGVIVKR